MREEKLIAGMNLYCDLWCERCPMTGCCEIFPLIHREDATNPEGFMMRQMQSIMQMQTEFLAIATEFKVRVTPDEFFRITEAKSRCLSNSRIRRLIRRGRDFGRLFGRFLDSGDPQRPLWEEDPEAVSNAIDEAIWFKLQVQFRTVLAGILRVWETDEPAETQLSWLHSDGYAKSALLAADRFQSALKYLQSRDWGSSALAEELRLELQQLRAGTLELFPSALHFVRPGLDELEGMVAANGTARPV